MEEKLSKLHQQLVNTIVEFCNDNNIEASSVQFGIDGLESSLEFGSWHPGTDSSFRICDKNDDVIYYSI